MDKQVFEFIRNALHSLERAAELVEADSAPENAETKWYLVSTLDSAMTILEIQLPEFEQAQHLTLLNKLGVPLGQSDDESGSLPEGS